MSGECPSCGEHCLDCKCSLTQICGSLRGHQRNDRQISVRHLNPKVIPLEDYINPPSERLLEPKYVNVRGREEHEAILKNSDKCKELGLDQYYEIMVYLRRWGSWLDTPPEKSPA